MDNQEVSKIREVGLSAWAVYCVLVRYGDHERHSFPSVELIAEHIGCSVRTVQRGIQRLYKRGWLTLSIRPGRPTVYRLWPPSGDDTSDTLPVIGVTPVSPRGDTSVAKGVTPVSPEEDLKKKTKEEEVVIVFPPALDTEEVQRAVQEWLDHHRAIGKPYKRPATQFAKIFKQFPTSAEFIAAVDHSIANNYQGLYAPGGKSGSRKTTDRRSSRF